MSHSYRQAHTGRLTVEDLRVGLAGFVEVLASLGYRDLKVRFGWGCFNLSVDELWNPLPMKVDDLEEFVKQAEHAGTFEWGEGDLIVETSDDTVRMTICHESDLHCGTADRTVFDKMLAFWRAQGLTVWVSSAPKDSVGPIDWKPFES